MISIRNNELLKKGFDIGKVHIDTPLCLGPMAGVTDLPFRILCKEWGCSLTYTEMVSAKGLYYGGAHTEELLATNEEETPSAVQIFGSDPEIMAKITRDIEPLSFDIVDINMGCPVPKVVNNGDGSALMKDPVLIGEIVKAVSEATEKPVTIKIRKGIEGRDNALEVALTAQANGAKAVAIHGRTREEYYYGLSDWNIIKELKDNLDIPVIGSGDVKNLDDAVSMMEQTGCDGVMIARAARGNPWVFSGRNDVTMEEIKEMILRHGKMLIDLKGEYTGIREMRKHVAWYVTGRPHASSIKREVNEVTTYEQLKALIS